jgi:hypothetical protein
VEVVVSLKRVFTLVAIGAVVAGAVVVSGAPRVSAQPDDVQSFLAAAALQPSDVPAGLSVQGAGPIDPAQAAQLAGIVGDDSAAAGLLGGYQQQLLADDFTAAFVGKPLAAGDAIFAFSSSEGAAAAQASISADNAQSVQQLLGGSDLGITITSVNTLTPPSLGDQAQEFELSGSLVFGGTTLNVTLDIVAVQRGAVQFEAVAGGLQPQQHVAEAIAQAIDTNVQANLALLTGS